MQKRPPIIAVMGHVDHGKTTLLDFIRKTRVAEREAGGITQSIGAYEIEVRPSDEPKSRESEASRGIPRQARDDFASQARKITFIDTPGHEAFTKMRAHSAKIADLAILVVAADDGVKPQTKDALDYILKEQIPYVVALNKIDKPGANIEKAKADLAQAGVYLEGFGGTVSWHAISAKTGEGVKDLLDLVLLASDLQELSYDPAAVASGAILTSKIDARRGAVVGVVLTNGTLTPGMAVRTASAAGKVKIVMDGNGKAAKEIVPSSPALVLGFETLPAVGETFFAGTPDETAKALEALPKKEAAAFGIVPPTDAAYTVPLIVKVDEAGSLEAMRDVLAKLAAELPLHVVDSGVGDIHENDVKLAESAHAIVLGFRVKTDKAAENMARNQKIAILSSNIIYELEKNLRTHAKKLSPRQELRAIEILAVFGAAKGKERVVGGRVALGPVKNQEPFEIWNGNTLAGEGRILNLQSKRQDVPQAETDQEVGLLVESAEPIKAGNRLVFPAE